MTQTGTPVLSGRSPRRPILVTGAHRSGTTWVAEVLSHDAKITFVDEPFNRDYYPTWIPRHLPNWFQYICKENEEEFADLIDFPYRLRYPTKQLLSLRKKNELVTFWLNASKAMRGRALGHRVLCKDPIGVFAAPWLADTYGAHVVVCIRHPAAFVSSLMKLEWHFDFANWSRQPLFMRDCAGPYAEPIEEYAAKPKPLIDQAILVWKVIHSRVAEYQRSQPGWLFARHEDLSDSPLESFREVFAALNVPFTGESQRFLLETSSPFNPADVDPEDFKSIHRSSGAAARTWRHRLDEGAIARVRAGTEEEASHFYSSASWDVLPGTSWIRAASGSAPVA